MDTERWYYRDGQQPVGPFLQERLAELAGAAIVTPDTLVRREGTDDWISLAGVMPAQHSTSVPPPLPIVLPASEHGGSPSRPSGLELSVGAEPLFAIPMTPGDEDDVMSERQWTPMPVAPWRRWAARVLDTVIHAFMGVLILTFAGTAIAPLSIDTFFAYWKSVPRLGDMVLSGVIAAIVGAVVVGSTGTSVGKAVFGVRVINGDGEPIGIIEGLGREFQVLLKGLGLGLPLISLITMASAYSNLKKQGATSWDNPNGHIVLHRPDGRLQYALNGVGVVLIVVVVVLIALGMRM